MKGLGGSVFNSFPAGDNNIGSVRKRKRRNAAAMVAADRANAR
jgi:hypothetical protein